MLRALGLAGVLLVEEGEPAPVSDNNDRLANARAMEADADVQLGELRDQPLSVSRLPLLEDDGVEAAVQ
jgi:hypothetical protein